ncbi:NUDIX hydrolase [Terrabacter sp. BE26]|uniref:NUDIX hydrolase n=1 Tax=Terrabacter sp. BE26 TaxID=2898152 RepID=UPI0035BE1D10
MGSHNMTETPRHSVSVAAAIFDGSGDNVLLIKRRDNGHWEPPGGVLELDETIVDGLRREVREETGAEVEVRQLTGVYKNMQRGIVALVFACHLATQPRTHSEEALEVTWVPVRELSKYMLPAYEVRIIDAAANDRAAVRAHDGTITISGTQ